MSKTSTLIIYFCGSTGWKIILEYCVTWYYNSVVIIMYDVVEVQQQAAISLALH